MNKEELVQFTEIYKKLLDREEQIKNLSLHIEINDIFINIEYGSKSNKINLKPEKFEEEDKHE